MMDTQEKREVTQRSISAIIESASRIHEAEMVLKQTGCFDISIEEEDTEQFQWMSLEYPESISSTSLHCCEEPSPISVSYTARLLGALLRKTLPKVLHTQGLTIRFRDNSIDFCISASIPSDETQMFLSLLREYYDCQQQSSHEEKSNHHS